MCFFFCFASACCLASFASPILNSSFPLLLQSVHWIFLISWKLAEFSIFWDFLVTQMFCFAKALMCYHCWLNNLAENPNYRFAENANINIRWNEQTSSLYYQCSRLSVILSLFEWIVKRQFSSAKINFTAFKSFQDLGDLLGLALCSMCHAWRHTRQSLPRGRDEHHVTRQFTMQRTTRCASPVFTPRLKSRPAPSNTCRNCPMKAARTTQVIQCDVMCGLIDVILKLLLFLMFSWNVSFCKRR